MVQYTTQRMLFSHSVDLRPARTLISFPNPNPIAHYLPHPLWSVHSSRLKSPRFASGNRHCVSNANPLNAPVLPLRMNPTTSYAVSQTKQQQYYQTQHQKHQSRGSGSKRLRRLPVAAGSGPHQKSQSNTMTACIVWSVDIGAPTVVGLSDDHRLAGSTLPESPPTVCC